jgi:hypothetical protein
MTKEDYKNFEKDKIQFLQQQVDKLQEEVRFLNNELLLCKETPKDIGIVSKGSITATPMIAFENNRVRDILQGRHEAMKRYTEKERNKDGSK